MKTHKLKPLCILSLLTLVALLTGCINERDSLQTPTGVGERAITFSVSMPGADALATYALQEPSENEVTQVVALLFEQTTGKYTYAPIWAGNIASSGNNGINKTFTLKIPEGTFDLMILANANQSLSQALTAATDPIVVGDSKATVISKLLQQSTGKWNTTVGSADYIQIPMWGEIEALKVDKNLTETPSIDLVRMLAKIDVTVESAVQADFKLHSVRLYNYNNQGQVVPNSTDWQNQAPSIPSSADKPTDPEKSPFVYNNMTTPDVACVGEIYTFEAAAGTSAGHLQNTCLVVGGTYTGDATDTYYRIDFAQKVAGVSSYLNILRNHNYKIDIAKVSGSGLPTPEEAFKSRDVLIDTEIRDWDNGGMSEVVSDGEYKFSVSASQFTLTREARNLTTSFTDHTLWVYTNVPTGWSVEKIVDNSGNDINSATNSVTGWLSLSPLSNPTIGKVETKLLLTENTSGAVRTGHIHFRAGRLRYVVKVIQTTEKTLALTIRDGSNTHDLTTLICIAPVDEAPAAQLFQVNWLPTDRTVSVVNTPVGTKFPFDFANDSPNKPGWGSETSYVDALGKKLLTIKTPAITTAEQLADPFIEKASRIDFTVNNGTDYLTKSIKFVQYAYNLVVDQLRNYYQLDGSTYTLRVRSNTHWMIKSVTEHLTSGAGSLLNLSSTDNLRPGTQGGVNFEEGKLITFTVASTSTATGTITVVFASTDNPAHFKEVTVTLNLGGEYYPEPHKGWAGSNIYWDGTKMTFDDVNDQTRSHYQGLYFQWGSLWGVSPVNDWSSTVQLYAPNGTSGSATSFGYGDWKTIPRVSNATLTSHPPIGKTEQDRNYLYEVTNGTTGIGDICKYLTEKGWAPAGKRWRMPTSMEFAATTGNYLNWTSVGSTAETNVGGTNTIAGGRNKAGTGNPFFPAAGIRNHDNGQLEKVLLSGEYWSGSPSRTNSWYMVFNNTQIIPAYENYRSCGFSVRCVQE